MARRCEDDAKEVAEALEELKIKVSKLDLQLKEIKQELNGPPICHKLSYYSRSSRHPRQGRKR